MSRAIEYQRLRAPRRDGEALIEPALRQAGPIIAENRRQFEQVDYDFQGRWLSELRLTAQAQMLHEAHRFTSAYRDVRLPDDVHNAPLVLAGHQPELFHPGVWLKNFALHALSQRHAAVAVNLLIDNDAVRAPSMRVPTGSIQCPRVVSVPIDAAAGSVPFERRDIVDRAAFDSFGQRAEQALAPLVPDPLLQQLWPLATTAAQATGNLGRALAQARHALEGRWDLQTLELPLSVVCRGEAFRWFVAHLLSQMPRVWDVFNTSLREYRQVHRLRSRSHPVPDLGQRDEWLETPFWVSTDDRRTRRHVWVRQTGEQIELGDGRRALGRLDLTADRDAGRAVEQLARFEEQGVRLRPRALMTTMFARLVLGDLFLHGIGGAKYDQLTDVLIGRLFDLPAPQFMVLSATFQLPLDRPQVSREQLRQLDRELRGLRFHPERSLADGANDSPTAAQVSALVAEKRALIARQPPHGHRKAWHDRMVTVNEAMQPFVAEKREKIGTERAELSTQLRNLALLASREYAFCLFPERQLRSGLLALLGPDA